MKNIRTIQGIVDKIARELDGIDTSEKWTAAINSIPDYDFLLHSILRDALIKRYTLDMQKSIEKFIETAR